MAHFLSMLRHYPKILEFMYTDTVDVYRKETITKKDKSTYVDYPDCPKLREIPCKYSVTGLDTSGNMTVERNPRYEQPKIFCDRGCGIRKGDKLVITRTLLNGCKMEAFEGYAGQASEYLTHTEILIVNEADEA